MLLPVDWLGFPHFGGECLKCVDEIEDPVGVGRLTEFHSRVMFWFQYVDVPKVQAEIDHLARVLTPQIIGPSHGLVIRENAQDYFEMMKEVVARVADDRGIEVGEADGGERCGDEGVRQPANAELGEEEGFRGSDPHHLGGAQQRREREEEPEAGPLGRADVGEECHARAPQTAGDPARARLTTTDL